MKIRLNGEEREFDAPLSVLGLLQAAGYGERRVAVEVNREIVARSRHGERALCEATRSRSSRPSAAADGLHLRGLCRAE
jgi:sulfur carrier protein